MSFTSLWIQYMQKKYLASCWNVVLVRFLQDNLKLKSTLSDRSGVEMPPSWFESFL